MPQEPPTGAAGWGLRDFPQWRAQPPSCAVALNCEPVEISLGDLVLLTRGFHSFRSFVCLSVYCGIPHCPELTSTVQSGEGAEGAKCRSPLETRRLVPAAHPTQVSRTSISKDVDMGFSEAPLGSCMSSGSLSVARGHRKAGSSSWWGMGRAVAVQSGHPLQPQPLPPVVSGDPMGILTDPAPSSTAPVCC